VQAVNDQWLEEDEVSSTATASGLKIKQQNNSSTMAWHVFRQRELPSQQCDGARKKDACFGHLVWDRSASERVMVMATANYADRRSGEALVSMTGSFGSAGERRARKVCRSGKFGDLVHATYGECMART
jgi:hypothetical protein